MPAPTFERRAAHISDDGLYRYSLFRQWGDGPSATWIMLNPSTADHQNDDPTIRRVRSFTQRMGCTAFEVVNLFAWRATDPSALATLSSAEAVGPENDEAIRRASLRGSIVIAAWGALAPWARYRDDEVLHALYPRRVHHLGALTKAGHPRHPLYLKGDAVLSELRSIDMTHMHRVAFRG